MLPLIPRTPPTTRERLLAAGVDLMAIVGVHDIGVTDLCHAAGIARRTFYHHFPTVHAVLIAADGQIDRELRRDVGRAWAAADRDGGAVVRSLIAFACRDTVRADAFFVQALALGTDVAVQRARTVAWCAALIVGQIDDPADEPTAPPPLALEVGFGGVWDVIRSRVAAGEFAGLQRDRDALVRIVAEYGAGEPTSGVSAEPVGP